MLCNSIWYVYVQLIHILTLKTGICDVQVCSTEPNTTALTPKHSSPHSVAEWGVSGSNGQAECRVASFQEISWNQEMFEKKGSISEKKNKCTIMRL